MKFLLYLLVLLCFSASAQDIFKNNRQWREKENKEFRDTATSPLTKEGMQTFDSLAFFPIREKYVVEARLELTPDSEPFKMKTTTDRLADYRQYGIAHFTIDDKEFQLPVYQNLRLLKMPDYKNYLFIPFTDLTNGEETYSGGRYVEASIPEDEILTIDFNKAYNPYCTYNHKYSCPIPPPENHLDTRIEAGVLDYKTTINKKKLKTPGASPMR